MNTHIYLIVSVSLLDLMTYSVQTAYVTGLLPPLLDETVLYLQIKRNEVTTYRIN